MQSLSLNILDVADWFVAKAKQDEDAGDFITHLKLQKLLYYAQAWGMVILGNKLYNEGFQAWAHGPVSRTVWDALKGIGKNPIQEIPNGDANKIDNPEVLDTLEEVWAVYGSKTAKYLENLSHSEAPWRTARGNAEPLDACQTVISEEEMYSFYRQYDAAQAA